jgi:hypothetical protein
MKLVVDNPTQVPAKRAGKLHRALPPLFTKMTGGDSAKINVMPDFSRILEARTPTREGDVEKNASDSMKLEEQPSIELFDRNYLDITPFGNLFEDMERKYEEDLKETAAVEFHKPDGRLVQDVKLIDARALFGSLRLDREGSGAAHQVMSDDTLAAILPLMGESDSPKERNSMGADKQLWPVPEQPRAGIVTLQEFSRTEKQPPIAGSPERAESRDVSTPAKSAATQGKTTETNFPSDMSAQRLEASSVLATTSPMQQIIERVAKMLPAQSVEVRHLPDGQKTVRFALQPDSLGDVSVVLRLRDSGVDLAIRPQLQETAQYLENSRDELLLSMKLSGVELGNVEIKPLDVATNQDARQDKPTAGQGGSHTSQFQSPHGGNPFHGGSKENQWRAPDIAEARKGVMDETEQAESGGSAVGRGIVL